MFNVRQTKRVISLLLIMVMLFTSFPMKSYAVSDFNLSNSTDQELFLTQEQIEAYNSINRSGRPSGLVGFEGDWDLEDFDDDEQISIIVEFVHKPVVLQQIEAKLEGESISEVRATDRMESDHEEFIHEMDVLFGESPISKFNMGNYKTKSYEITAVYTKGMSGAAVKLPASKVGDVAEFNSVYAIYPNNIIRLDPVTEPDDSRIGMADTRAFLDIARIHEELGLTGDGVTVGIIDTGVDYYHPDLEGAFSDEYHGKDEDMKENGKIGGKYYGRSFVVYDEAGFGYGTEDHYKYNPMETTYKELKDAQDFHGYEYPSEYDDYGNSFYTSHGTHVAGTIASRGINTPVSALGMAPNATILSYRALGPYGMGLDSWILEALDCVVDDNCDIVNMSLGAGVNDPGYITSVVINQLILQYDIIFVISSGNFGPYSSTLGSPGTSSLAITIGNGTVDVLERTVSISAPIAEETDALDMIDMREVRNPQWSEEHKSEEMGELEEPEESEEINKSEDEEIKEQKNPEEEIELPEDEPEETKQPEESEEPEYTKIHTTKYRAAASISGKLEDAEETEDLKESEETEESEMKESDVEESKIDESVTEDPEVKEPKMEENPEETKEPGIEDSTEESKVEELNIKGLGIEEIEETGEHELYTEETEMQLLVNDYSSISSDNGSWYMEPDLSDLELVILEDKEYFNNIEINGISVGQGTRHEFENMPDEIEGKIVVVSRGQAFVTTAELAKEFGAAAVIVITNEDSIYYGFQDAGNKYVPLFLTEERNKAVEVIERALNDNEGKLILTNYVEEISKGGFLHSSSSRGPVGDTMDIKPDVVAPGTQVLSTVPFYETTTGDRTNKDAPEAYEYSYLRYTGTSMSAPHVAGIVALLIQYSNENELNWSVTEVKARIMNTADSMDEYSVHEVGSGYINPYKAIMADSHITVDYDNVYVFDATVGIGAADGQLSSLNFGAFATNKNITQSNTLNMNIHNDSGTAKTYDLNYISNHKGFKESDESYRIAGQNVWDNEDVKIDFSTNTVTVNPYSTETVEVTISTGADIQENSAGFLEGYVQVYDETEETVYRLPFAATIANDRFFEEFYFNHPALTTAGVEFTSDKKDKIRYDNSKIHFVSSLSSDLYFQITQPIAGSIFIIIAENDIEDPYDTDKWIGEAGIMLPGYAHEVGSLYYYKDVIGPTYLRITDDSQEPYELDILPEGHYKVMLYAQTWMGNILSEPVDFFVDNTLPELCIDNNQDGIVSYLNDNIQVATVTGNIHDEVSAQMQELGAKYNIYDSSDDYHSPEADQGLNAIFASVEGRTGYTQATIDSNGNFNIELTGLNESGETNVTLYYLDSFSASQFEEGSFLSRGFNPYGPSLNSYYGGQYAFKGLNKGVKEITLKHDGAGMAISPTSIVLDVGETEQLAAIFNEGALNCGYDTVVEWKSSNENVAIINSSGLTTAVGAGEALLTATSNLVEGISLTAEVKVRVIGPGDGINLKEGNQLWFGLGTFEDYGGLDPTDYDNPLKEDIRFTFEDDYAGENVPYQWTVMGEEQVNGFGDGYLTLISQYGIRTLDYTDDGSYANYEDSNLIEYLNNELLNVFNEVELGVIPYVDVVTDGRVLENQRAYIPWGIDADSDNALANNVFWSAGDEINYANSIHGSSDVKNLARTRGISQLIFSTYFLRNSDPESSQLRVVRGGLGDVELTDDWSYNARGNFWFESQWGSNWSEFEIGTIVRPVIKLDLSKVLYAYRYPYGGMDARHISDAKGNVYSANEWEYDNSIWTWTYKLSVLGGNNGEDVGRLNGINTETQTIEAGKKITMRDVTSTNYGSDYVVAYKIVGDNEDGDRETFVYHHVNSSENPQDIDIYSAELNPGDYKVYLWLQKDSGYIPSYEAGVVESFDLVIEPTQKIEGIDDGVAISDNSFIYLGSHDHPVSTNVREGYETPVLWKVMGQQVDEGENQEEYYTLFSEHVLERTKYAGGATTFEEANVHLFLNRTMNNIFSNAEDNAIAFVTVNRQDYDIFDEVNDPYREMFWGASSVGNQKMYLPWGIKYVVDTEDPWIEAKGRSMFWDTTDNYKIDDNAIAYRYDERIEVPKAVYGRFKGGSGTSYWLDGATGNGPYQVNNNGQFTRSSYASDWANPTDTAGVRPLIKLDSSNVVYMKQIGVDMEADDTYYAEPPNGETHYKLTVLGTHGGKDIGYLSNVPSSFVTPVDTETILNDVGLDSYGTNYSICYKIVTTVDGQRVIVKYNEMDADTAAAAITLDTKELEEGRYDVYIWIQENNQLASDETGVVSKIKLTVGEEVYTKDLENELEKVENAIAEGVLSEEEYTEESWQGLLTAIEGAKRVLENQDATQEEVDEAEGYLTEAVKNLVKKELKPKETDKSILKEAISNAEAVNQDIYTKESVTVLNEELKNAKGVFNDETATQEEVDLAAESLSTAIKNLLLKPTVSAGSKHTAKVYYDIKVIQGIGGKISPDTVSAVSGSEKTFTVTPDDGYRISDVLVDGKSIGAVSEYTFKSIKNNHTIEAKFVEIESAQPNKIEFADVAKGVWYEKAVYYIAEKGIIKGMSENTFEPANNVTRAQFITLIGRLAEYMGEDISGYTTKFEDVLKDQWYTDYVAWGETKGIIKGYDDKTYGINDKITREQVSVILSRFAEYMNIEFERQQMPTFIDETSISPWAYEYVINVSEAELMTGSNDHFYPQRYTSRAETAQVLMNLIQKYVE